MKIELEFFEYPKHKPVMPQDNSSIMVLAFTTLHHTLHEFLYKENSKYIFDDLLAGGFEYEPYVTHWAYLPKKV